jgi:hypothetical protein
MNLAVLQAFYELNNVSLYGARLVDAKLTRNGATHQFAILFGSDQ